MSSIKTKTKASAVSPTKNNTGGVHTCRTKGRRYFMAMSCTRTLVACVLLLYTTGTFFVKDIQYVGVAPLGAARVNRTTLSSYKSYNKKESDFWPQQSLNLRFAVLRHRFNVNFPAVRAGDDFSAPRPNQSQNRWNQHKTKDPGIPHRTQ